MMALAQLIISKGGPGSGHHGHSGLPGVHGGSRPGKGGASASEQHTAAVKDFQDADPNDRELWDWAAQAWDDWYYHDTTPDQRDIIRQYANDSSDLNAYLRDGGDLELQNALETFAGIGIYTDDIDDIIHPMDEALSKSQIPEDMVVYRGFKSPKRVRELAAAPAGTVFQDNAYVSTSFTRQALLGTFAHSEPVMEMANKYGETNHWEGYLLRIRLSKGQTGAYIGNISELIEENEILLPRGARFRTVGVTETIDGPPFHRRGVAQTVKFHILDVEYLGSESGKHKELNISKGGPGSGHHGHAGRPGKRGGSLPRGASASEWDDEKALRFFATFDDGTDPGNEWGEREYKEWVDGLSGRELDAINTYCGASGRTINKALRNHEELHSQYVSVIKELDEALERSQIPTDVVVYRGIGEDSWTARPDQRIIHKLRSMPVGTVFQDLGYVSTSLHDVAAHGFASGGAVLEIRLRKGQRGAYVSGISTMRGESEILLPRGSKFRIVHMPEPGSNVYLYPIVVEYIEPGVDISKGGPGSGHHGHAGRPGKRGGSRPSGSATASTDITAPSQRGFDKFIEGGIDDGEYTVRIGGNIYDIITESWFPDCMESRDLGETEPGNIGSQYLDIMVGEAGWDKADIHNYIQDAYGAEYGISYIGRLKEYNITKGGPGSGHHGHAGRPGKVGGSVSRGAVGTVVDQPDAFEWPLGMHYTSDELLEKRADYTDKWMDWRRSLTVAEKDAIAEYTDVSFSHVNKHLRHPDPEYPVRDDAIRLTELITSAIDKASMPEDTIVYRGMSYSVLHQLEGVEALAGAVLYDKGFASTTLRLEQTNPFARIRYGTRHVLKMRLPKGTRAAYTHPYNESNEDEIIVQRGSKFRLTGHVYHVASQSLTYAVYEAEYIGGRKSKFKGGPGSGHHGHAGRPGKRGGSVPGKGTATDRWANAFNYDERLSWNEQGLQEFIDNWLGWINNLNGDQRTLLRSYAGSGHRGLNRWLRNDGQIDYEDIRSGYTAEMAHQYGYDTPQDLWRTVYGGGRYGLEAATDVLHEAVMASESPTDMITYRGISERIGQSIIGNGVGTIFQDKGFSSTSLRESKANTFSFSGAIRGDSYVVKIRVPKGTPAAFIANFGPPSEMEVLLPHSSTFRIIDISNRMDGTINRHTITVDYIPPTEISKGGPGSGHRGHAGRPGKRGGSVPGKADRWASAKDFKNRQRSSGDVRDYWEGSWAGWVDSLSDDEKMMLHYYTKIGYIYLNEGLRKGWDDRYTGLAEDYFGVHHNEVLYRMDSALNRSEAPEDLIVYRGLRYSQRVKKLFEQPAGTVFQDDGYTSTTLTQHVVSGSFAVLGPDGGYMARIRVGKGQKAAGLAGASTKDLEREVLLPRSAKFRILGVTEVMLRSQFSGIDEPWKMLEVEYIEPGEEISKGGPGSGHHGHSGRPGKRGGSVPRGAVGTAVGQPGAFEDTKWHDFGNVGTHEKSEAIDKFIEEGWGEWQDSLTNHEKFMIRGYSGMVYRSLNEYLRNEGVLSDTNRMILDNWVQSYGGGDIPTDDIIGIINDAVGDAKAPNNMIVYRGTGSGQHIIGLGVGTVFQDKAFTSTSLLAETASMFSHEQDDGKMYITKIRVPKGSSAAYIGKFGISYEREVLLPTNSSFRISSIDEGTVDTVAFGIAPVVFITVDYLGQEETTKELNISKGGPGSGHHGHSGRPGKRGGSLPGTGGVSTVATKRKLKKFIGYKTGLSNKDIDSIEAQLKEEYGFDIYHIHPDDWNAVRVDTMQYYAQGLYDLDDLQYGLSYEFSSDKHPVPKAIKSPEPKAVVAKLPRTWNKISGDFTSLEEFEEAFSKEPLDWARFERDPEAPPLPSHRNLNWEQSITEGEWDSIRGYTGSGYGSINRALRQDEELFGWQKEDMNNVTSALEKSSLAMDTVVYRGFMNGATNNQIEALPVGTVFQDKAFVSASASAGLARTYYYRHVVQIRLPKGSKAGYVELISQSPSEWETVLQRGGIYRVSGRKMLYEGTEKWLKVTTVDYIGNSY